jgi:hypothetical protein
MNQCREKNRKAADYACTMKNERNMKRIIFLWASLLSTMGLSAQITFAEKPAEKPGWEYMRDAIMAPYDSTDLHIQVYPLLEAYKKYIGQRLFFIKPNNSDEMIKGLNRDDVNYKYYDIIDVVSADHSVFANKANCGICDYQYRYLPENKIDSHKRSDFDVVYVKSDNQPCFILQDVESADTLYLYMKGLELSPFPPYKAYQKIILLGGFLKLKESMIGQNFVYYWDRYNSKFGGIESQLKSVWTCTDISITTNDYFTTYNDEIDKGSSNRESLAFILRNNKDTTIIGNLQTERLIPALYISDYPNSSGWATEKSFHVYEKKLNKIKQQLTKQEEQKRQQLIAKYGAATAEKIIAGKFEIGMGKAVCKEIAGYVNVIDKTTTTETWKISNIWTGGATYLYFSGDKLARIVNY